MYFDLWMPETVRLLCQSILDKNHFRIKAEEEEEDLLDAYATPGKVRHILKEAQPRCGDCVWLKHDCVHRALRKERWQLRNIPSQKEALLFLPVQDCCCLPPAFLPGIFFKTLVVSQPNTSHIGQVPLTLSGFTLRFSFLTSFASATPSLKYSQRGAKGEVVATFGSVQGTRWAGSRSGVQLELLEGPDNSLHTSYKYMFQRLRDIRNGK